MTSVRLARAYLGGASAVVSSSWPVEDEATRLSWRSFTNALVAVSMALRWLLPRGTVKAKGYPPSSYGAFVLGGTLGGQL